MNEYSSNEQQPNKAPEPTATAVMPRAIEPLSEMKQRAEMRCAARVMPAVAVAHLYVRQKMKPFRTLGFIALLLFAAACSEPPRFLFLNKSGQDIVVELPQRKIPLADGQFVDLHFDPSMVLWCAKERRVYQWRYPLPVIEFFEFGRESERFVLSLESNGKIYARKIVDGKPANNIPAQPIGYPLAVLN